MSYELFQAPKVLTDKKENRGGRPQADTPNFPFKEMEVGQVFEIQSEREYGKSRTAVWALNKYTDRKYGGTRISRTRWAIWRIA